MSDREQAMNRIEDAVTWALEHGETAAWIRAEVENAIEVYEDEVGTAAAE